MKKARINKINIHYFGGKYLTVLLLLLSTTPVSSAYAAAIAGGDYQLAPGWNYMGRADVTLSMTMIGRVSNDCVYEGYWFGDYSGWFVSGANLSKSSDGVATGFKSHQGDVVLVFRGGQVAGQNLNSSCTPTQIPSGTWDASGQYSVLPKMSEWGDAWKGGVTVKNGSDYYRWQKRGVTTTSRVNTDIYVYVGPMALIGQTYNIGETFILMEEHGASRSSTTISGGMNIIVTPPRTCTVQLTPQNIDFGVHPLPERNGIVATTKMQQLTINCVDGNTTDPVLIDLVFTSEKITTSSTYAPLFRNDGEPIGSFSGRSSNIKNNRGILNGDFNITGIDSNNTLAGNSWASTIADIEWSLRRATNKSPAGQGTGKITMTVTWP